MKLALLPSTQPDFYACTGGTEAFFCTDIAQRVSVLLAGKIEAKVFVGETYADSDGAKYAVEWNPDYALSLHLDAGGAPAETALGLYQEDRSFNYCKKLLDAYCRNMGYESRGMMKRTPGIDGVAVLRIPEAANIPAALLELDTQDKNPEIAFPEWRDKCARALASALTEIFGIITEGEDEGMNFELIKDSGGNPIKDQDGLFVFGVAARKSQTMMAYAVEEKATKVKLYFVPPSGNIITKDWMLGGWEPGNHGTYYALVNFTDVPAQEFFLELHCGTTKLYGGVF